MVHREFERIYRRLEDLSNRLELVERRLAQLENRFGMMEEDLRLYREKATQIGAELDTFKNQYKTEQRKSMKVADVWEKELYKIRERIEKLESIVFKK